MKLFFLVTLLLIVTVSSEDDEDYYDDDYYEEEEPKLIEAPVEYLKRRDRIVKLKAIGPSAWICAEYDDESPWLAFEALEDYLGGNNEKGIKFQKVTWPMVKTIVTAAYKKDVTPSICHYMEQEYHCSIPKPKTPLITVEQKLPKRVYWAHEFWGKASDRRIRYIIDKKLTRRFKRKKIIDLVDMGVAYQSTFPNNLKEVGYLVKDQSQYLDEFVI